MNDIVTESTRGSLKTQVRTGSFAHKQNLSGTTVATDRKAYQNVVMSMKDPRYLSQPGVIPLAAPFTIPIRYGSYNLNADVRSLKFTPRSGSHIRITQTEAGDSMPSDFNNPVKIDQGGMQAAERPPPSTVSAPLPPPTSAPIDTSSTNVEQMPGAFPTIQAGQPPSNESPMDLASPSGAPSGTLDASLSEIAYTAPATRPPTLGSLHYNPAPSTDELAIYENNASVMIGIRGTATTPDLITDLYVGTGTLNKSSRYQRNYNEIKTLVHSAKEQHKQIVISGHSLGGSLASDIVERLIKEDPALALTLQGKTFNEGTTFLASNKCTTAGCKNITRRRIRGDVVSASEKNTTTHETAVCGGSAHGIGQFTHSCKNQKTKKGSRIIPLVEKPLATVAQTLSRLHA